MNKNLGDGRRISQKNIDLSELKSGGPPKDGIPAINNPTFISQEQAAEWIEDSEPVIAFEFLARNRDL